MRPSCVGRLEREVTLLIALSALMAMATTTSTTEGTCQQVGKFTGGGLPELSGLAFSRDFDRAYAINDSGNAFKLFITSPTGAPIQSVTVSGNRPPDTEDLSLGPCPRAEGGSCLFIADVGDNGNNRGSVKLIIVEERPAIVSPVVPLKTLVVKYSDGRSHNCEGAQVHPVTGDMFFVSKVEEDPHVYKIPAADLKAATSSGSVTARDIGTIDLESMFANADELVTGLAISPDGSRFALLTYSDAYEFEFDLGGPQTVYTSQLLKANRTKFILTRLKQQEAIAYSPRDGGLYYTTETGTVSTDAPLIRVQNSIPCAGATTP